MEVRFQLLSSSAPLPRNKTTYSWIAGSRAILDPLEKRKWRRNFNKVLRYVQKLLTIIHREKTER
jgi:hypothetical protein